MRKYSPHNVLLIFILSNIYLISRCILQDINYLSNCSRHVYDIYHIDHLTIFSPHEMGPPALQ
jgi:hypothetical protein